MNFLQLAQRLRQESGLSGSGPTSVTGQTGESKRLVDWIASAWLDIQTKNPQWNWMRGDFTFTTTADQQAYTSTEAGIASRFSHWCLDSVWLGTPGSNDESELCQLDYSDFRRIYIMGAQVTARPVAVTSTPSMSLALGNTPNGEFLVRGEYMKSPQTLSADADIPEMPEQFHEAIMYRALMMYARYAAAPEIYDDALASFSRIYSRLQLHQLPNLSEVEPLA